MSLEGVLALFFGLYLLLILTAHWLVRGWVREFEREGTMAGYRTEISPEVYDVLASNLKAAMAEMKALRQSIPCYLSAPAVVSGRLEKHLAVIQGAVGSIDVVRIDGLKGPCPLCQELYEGKSVAGLCPACAKDRGLKAEGVHCASCLDEVAPEHMVVICSGCAGEAGLVRVCGT